MHHLVLQLNLVFQVSWSKCPVRDRMCIKLGKLRLLEAFITILRMHSNHSRGEFKPCVSMRDVHLTGGGEQTCVSLTLMPFTVVMFSFSSDSKDTRRVLLLAPIPGQTSPLMFNLLVHVNLISSYELQRVDSSLIVTREYQGCTLPFRNTQSFRHKPLPPGTGEERRFSLVERECFVSLLDNINIKINTVYFKECSFIRWFINIKSTIYEINVYFRAK